MKLSKSEIIVTTVSLVFFCGYSLKDILDYREVLHTPSGGKVERCEHLGGDSYMYYTNRATTLNSKYFFDKNPNIREGDYLIKYPHSFELYVLRLDENELLTPDPKIVGSFK